LAKVRKKGKDKLFETWLAQLWKDSPQTARGYEAGLRRLLGFMKIDSKTLLSRAKRDPKKTWVAMKEAAKGFPKNSVAITGLYAGRRFLLDHDEYLALPAAHLKIKKVKPPVHVKWDDANAIADAASLPYNMIFKIMVHTGWGIGEFLKFNTAETWARVKANLAKDPTAEYFRFDFSGRKKNDRPFFSLVPMKILAACVALEATKGMVLPMCGRGRNGANGIPLDHAHVFVARTYIESSFRTALKRAPVTDVQGRPGAHELRDVFFTRAVQVGCAESAADFVMGHMVDGLGYNKASNDEKWVWGEVKKVSALESATFEEIDSRLAKIEDRTLKGGKGSRYEVLQLVKEARAELAQKWISGLSSGRAGSTVNFQGQPEELTELDQIIELLENPKTTRLEVYKAQKRFDRIIGV
jgi:hypothetical protein